MNEQVHDRFAQIRGAVKELILPHLQDGRWVAVTDLEDRIPAGLARQWYDLALPCTRKYWAHVPRYQKTSQGRRMILAEVIEALVCDGTLARREDGRDEVRLAAPVRAPVAEEDVATEEAAPAVQETNGHEHTNGAVDPARVATPLLLLTYLKVRKETDDALPGG
jgi:hypothetical protein